MVGGWGGGANKLGPRVRLIKVKRGHKGGALVPEDWCPYEKRHQRAPFSLPETQKKGPREDTVGRRPPHAGKEASQQTEPAGGWLFDFHIQNGEKINARRSGQAGSLRYFVTAAALTSPPCVPLPLPSCRIPFFLPPTPPSISSSTRPSSISPFLLYSFLLPFLLSNLPPFFFSSIFPIHSSTRPSAPTFLVSTPHPYHPDLLRRVFAAVTPPPRTPAGIAWSTSHTACSPDSARG